MKLKSVTLENFRAHRHTEIRFPDTGIIGLVGDNESGKSSILESLTWALYGAKGIRGRMSDLRWRGASARKSARATWLLEIGGDEYTVERTERAAQVRLGDEVVAATTSGVTEYMEKVVGMTLDEFRSSYLCDQKDVARIVVMKPEARRKFVRAVMGQDILDRAVEEARRRRNELKTQLVGFRAAMVDGTAAKDRYNEAMAQVRRRDEEVTDHQELVLRHNRDLDRKQIHAREARRLKREYDDIAGHVARTREKEDGLRDSLQMLKEAWAEQRDAGRNVEVMNRELLALPEARQREAEIAGAVALVDRIERREAEIEEATAKLARLRDRQHALGEVADRYDPGNHRACERRHRDLQTRARNMEANRMAVHNAACTKLETAEAAVRTLEAAIGDGNCPTCGRELENLDKLRQTLADAKVDVAEHSKDKEDTRNPPGEETALGAQVSRLADDLGRHEKQRRRSESAAAERNAVAREARDVAEDIRTKTEWLDANPRPEPAYHPDMVTRARERVEHLTAMKGRLEVLKREAEKLPRTTDSLATTRGAISDVRLVLEEQERQLAGHPWKDYGDDKLQELADAEGAAAREVRLHEHRHNQAKVAAATAHQAARDALAAVETWKEQRERERALAHELGVAEAVLELLAKFRLEVLSSVRPELAELVSGLVAVMSDGRHESAELDDSFGVVLHEGGMPSPVISGGTEDIAALALRIALAQLIAERSGRPLTLLLLDEPLGGLDKTRRANVLSLLHRLRGHFPQVVLISHVSETREAVDVAIELEYSETKGATEVIQ